jgi:hypothetical protein
MSSKNTFQFEINIKRKYDSYGIAFFLFYVNSYFCKC